MQDQPKAIYFLSDAHLGSGADQEMRQRTLIAWLRHLRTRAAHLYILGDLFDFWFEYRHAVPKSHFRVLRALAELVEAGTPVSYLGGNHDFWCGAYLERDVGLHVHQRPITVSHQGRRIFLAHGDGIGPGDTGYRIVKAVLRHRLAIALYRTIHPDLGIPLAYRVSKTSRKHSLGHDVLLRRMARHLVGPRFAQGEDAVVIGHIHTPTHLRDGAGRDFVIVGDWLQNRTYVRLAAGEFHLERFRESGAPESQLPARWPRGLDPGH